MESIMWVVTFAQVSRAASIHRSIPGLGTERFLSSCASISLCCASASTRTNMTLNRRRIAVKRTALAFKSNHPHRSRAEAPWRHRPCFDSIFVCGFNPPLDVRGASTHEGDTDSANPCSARSSSSTGALVRRTRVANRVSTRSTTPERRRHVHDFATPTKKPEVQHPNGAPHS